ncbi:MAG: hypothetical protein WC238_04660 [Parcubacteria group bacterium]|jgi:hypothetical protein
MGLKPNFSTGDVAKYLEQRRANIEAIIIRNLQYLGEQCVNQARSNGDYTDQTGNLRSSVGYVVVARGQIVQNDFQVASSGGEVGVTEGSSLAEKLAQQYKSGYALIVVAGMDYALYVEAKHHRDVLTSAEQYAQQKLPMIMAKLGKKIR